MILALALALHLLSGYVFPSMLQILDTLLDIFYSDVEDYYFY